MGFQATRVDDRISRIEETGVVPFMRCNIWHVRGRNFDLVIDTGFGISSLKTWIVARGDRAIRAICTHSHFDHVAGLAEFSCRLGHRLEAPAFAAGGHDATMFSSGWTDVQIVDPEAHPGFDNLSHVIRPAPLTGYLDEGDVVDLGDVSYQVLHLPGHSPGSIGLWDAASQTLFSGDAVYDGPLYDGHPHSDPDLYLKTLDRLRKLGARTVHGGHYASFGEDRLRQIVDGYHPLENSVEAISDLQEEFRASGG